MSARPMAVGPRIRGVRPLRAGVAEGYVLVLDRSAQLAALEECRGTYQRDLVLGAERLSGGGLRGAAATYRERYVASARHLLERLTAAGVPWSEGVAPHGRRVLILGQIPAGGITLAEWREREASEEVTS